jgi:hypothetical protein
MFEEIGCQIKIKASTGQFNSTGFIYRRIRKQNDRLKLVKIGKMYKNV